MKKKNIVLYIIILVSFFLVSSEKVNASDVIISNNPKASNIVYGEPLFSSKLIGGVASVSGSFYWKENNKVLSVGSHVEKVIFDPDDPEVENIEIDIQISVSPRKVYLKFEHSFYKQYDGNNKINVPNYIVGGIIDKNIYLTGNIEAKVETVFVGENIKVIISGIELQGENTNNYYLDLNGYSATIHPNYIEEFGEERNRVIFNENTFIPANSILDIETVGNNDLNIDKYEIKHVYDLKIRSNQSTIKVDDKVNVRIKIDDEKLGYKGIKLYNYYNGKYEELDYEYKDGYLNYECVGMGFLIIAQKENGYMWIYIIGILMIACLGVIVVRKFMIKENKIYRYKSLKRRKDYGDYC